MSHWALSNFLNRSSLRIVTEPTEEQLTLADAYLHLRLDPYGSPEEHPDDPWLATGISAAREWCEGYSGRMLAPQVLELSLNRFPVPGGFSPYRWPYGYVHALDCGGLLALPIDLKVCPVVGIESVSYIDGDGTTQTLDPSSYVLDNATEPCLIYPAYGASWPTTRQQPNAITVRFHAGHTLPTGSPDDYPLPKRYKSAMLLVLGHLYENRENTITPERGTIMEIPLGAAELMQRDMIRMGMA